MCLNSVWKLFELFCQWFWNFNRFAPVCWYQNSKGFIGGKSVACNYWYIHIARYSGSYLCICSLLFGYKFLSNLYNHCAWHFHFWLILHFFAMFFNLPSWLLLSSAYSWCRTLLSLHYCSVVVFFPIICNE